MKRSSGRANVISGSNYTRRGGKPVKGSHGVVRTKVRIDKMNKGERAYAEYLQTQVRTGTIAAWWYEHFTWKIADDTRYTPDFLVQYPDGMFEVHEVKGRKTRKLTDGTRMDDGFAVTPNGWLKLKIVGEQMPIDTYIVWPSLDGDWNSRKVGETE